MPRSVGPLVEVLADHVAIARQDRNTIPVVEPDGVPGATLADRVVAGTVDRDADQVAEGVAGGVGTDEVADDEVAGRTRAADRDAGRIVEADCVGVRGGRPAESVAFCSPFTPSIRMPTLLPGPDFVPVTSMPIRSSAIVSPFDSTRMALPAKATISSPSIVLPWEPDPRTSPSDDCPAPLSCTPLWLVPSIVTGVVMSSGSAGLKPMTFEPMMAEVMWVVPSEPGVGWASAFGSPGRASRSRWRRCWSRRTGC